MKQKQSPHLNPLLPQKRAGQAPGEEEKESLIALNGTILQKLTTLEDLLRKKDDKPLTFKEACAYLGYAPSYLYKLTYRNVIPHYKPTGKMIFFSKNELDEWIYTNAEGKGHGADNCEQRDTSTALGIKDTNQFGIKDPNQIEMELKEDASTSSAQEIVIEFPLKSRRKQ